MKINTTNIVQNIKADTQIWRGHEHRLPASGVHSEFVDAENDPVWLQEAVDNDHDDDGDDEEVDDEVNDGGATLSYALRQFILESQEATLSRIVEEWSLWRRVPFHSGQEAPSEDEYARFLKQSTIYSSIILCTHFKARLPY